MNKRKLIHQSLNNQLYSFFLLGSMVVLLILIGYIFAGITGVYFVVTTALVLSVFGPGVSPRFILRLYRGRYLAPQESPELYKMVRRLSEKAGLVSMPDLYYIPSRILNAFAVGTDGNGAIGVTDGLLRKINSREMAGVLAHEISHIANKDVSRALFSGMIGKIIGGLSIVGQIIILINLPYLMMGQMKVPWISVALLAFAPSLNGFLQLAFARAREYDADLSAVRLTGDPKGLAMALRKIEHSKTGVLQRVFMTGYRVSNKSILSTHPDTDARIKRLLELTGEMPLVERYTGLIDSPGLVYSPVVTHRMNTHRGFWFVSL